MLIFRALGGAAIEADGHPVDGKAAQRRQLALVALLAASHAAGVSREKVIGYLWPEKTEKSARASLSQSLYVLRREFGEHVIVDVGGELRLSTLIIDTDLARFETACGQGEWESAVLAYGGPFLDGFHLGDAPEFERWAEAVRDRLARAHRNALEEMAQAAAARGDQARAAEWWRRVAALEPECARVALQLMHALETAGDRAAAIAHARVYAVLLKEEYGSEPDPGVMQLAERLRVATDPPRDGPLPAAVRPLSDQNGPPRGSLAELLTQSPIEPANHSTGPGRIHPRRWRVAAAALLIGALGLLLWAAGRDGDERGAQTVDVKARVAVFPFVVRGPPEFAYLTTGMTTLLSTSLDGAGALSAVEPHVLLEYLHQNDVGALDHRLAAEHARRLRATSYVLGEVVATGGRLRLHARWYDPEYGAGWLAEAGVEGDAGDLIDLTARLAAELWSNRTAASGNMFSSSAGRTTSSLPALKEYLEGERYRSTGNYPAAVKSFQLALAIDSTFGYAAYRLGTVAEWVGNWPLAAEARDQAMRFSSSLPPRERLLTDALRAARDHDAATAMRLYRTSLEQNPADVEALYGSAQTQYRLGALIGLAPHEARAGFERVRTLDTTHVPALMHLVQSAAWAGDRVALDTLLVSIVADFPHDPLWWQHLAAVAGGHPDPEGSLQIDYDAMSDSTLWRLALNATLYTQNRDGAERVARHLVDANRPAELRVAGHLLLSFMDMTRGRPRAAGDHLADVAPLDSAAYLEYRALLATPYFLPIPPGEVRAIRNTVAAWAGTGRENRYLPLWSDMYAPVAEYLMGVLSARVGDADAARQHVAALESLGGTPLGLRLNSQRANAVRARLAAHRGDSAAALALLAQTEFPRSSASGPHINHEQRNLRPSLLRSLGRRAEALAAFDALPWRGSFYAEQTLWDLMYVAPFHFEKAELLGEMGRDAEAVKHYVKFIELWREADPELQPRVRKARRELARIRGGGGG